MARLVRVVQGRELSFELLDELTVVGTDAECDVRIDVEGAPARLFEIRRTDEGWVLRDLCGRTRVNGQTADETRLSNGDAIEAPGVRFTFRGGVRPEPIAPARGPAAPRREVPPRSARSRPSPVASRRAAGARRAASGRRAAAEEAGAGRPLRRERIRQPGMSGVQTALVATAVGVAVLIAGYFVLRDVPSDDLGRRMEEAKRLFHAARYAEAKAVLDTIPGDAAIHAAAERLRADIERAEREKLSLADLQWGTTEYENNIRYFLDTQVRKHPDDLAYVRVLVMRCKEFLERVPKHKYAADVRRLLQEYEPKIRGVPITWHDIEVMADRERARQRYGPARALVVEWLREHEATADEYEVKRAKSLLGHIERGAMEWWRDQVKRAAQNVKDGNFSAAYGKYLTARRRFQKWPEMLEEVERYIRDLKAAAPGKLVEPS